MIIWLAKGFILAAVAVGAVSSVYLNYIRKACQLIAYFIHKVFDFTDESLAKKGALFSEMITHVLHLLIMLASNVASCINVS